MDDDDDDERAVIGADDVGAAELAAAEAGDGVAVRRRLGSCTYTRVSLAEFHTTLQQLDRTLLYCTTIISNLTTSQFANAVLYVG